MKALLSVSISLVFCAIAAAGLYLRQSAEMAERSSRENASEISALRDELENLQAETRELKEDLRRVDSLQDPRPATADAGEGSAAPVPVAASAPEAGAAAGDIKAYVVAALEEDRRKHEEDRKKEREELRQRAEEKRKERAALSEGPYERYNLKVNSMARALALNDAQKQTYYELVKRFREELRQGRTKDAPAGEIPASGPGKGPDRDQRAKFRQVYADAQKRFTEAFQGLLSTSQAEAYSQLSEASQGFQDLGMVTAAGAEGGNAGRSRGGGPGAQGKTAGPKRR